MKNVESLGGKSDPYVRVQIRNETKGKTSVVSNDLNPVWDEVIYVPIHAARESIMLECLDKEKIGEDRPLGSVELDVFGLIQKTTDPKFPFQSAGTQSFEAPITRDDGRPKGTLFYQATFVPAWQTHVHFHKSTTPVDSSSDDDSDAGYVSDATSIDGEEGVEPVDLTFKPKPSAAGAAAQAVGGAVGGVVSGVAALPGVSTVADTVAKVPNAGAPRHSAEELLAQQSGIVVFNVVSARLHNRGHIEVVLDDSDWPCVSTPKSKSKTPQWEYVGEGFVKEIDFSQVHMYLDEATEEGEDRVSGEWSGPMKTFLRDTLHGPQEFTLTDKRGKTSTVLVEARYIPVPITLEPRESVSNQGTLRVELIDGEDILAVDKGGTRSDPFVVFTLNGSKVHKSEVQRKTVTPVWNEEFDINITSRATSELQVEVFDWDRIGSDETLGTGTINLQTLEPFGLTERSIALSHAKHGQKGRVRVRLLFTPQIIAKARKTATTFSSVGTRAMTGLGALPANAGKGVLGGVQGIFGR